MNEETMWKDFYHKIVVEKETKEKEEQENSEHETRIQETDGGFFENLGTLLAEKVRAQEQEEGPLPKKRDEVQGTREEEDNFSEEGSIEEPVDALLETDSDRDENEHATNFLAESMGWNNFIYFEIFEFENARNHGLHFLLANRP